MSSCINNKLPTQGECIPFNERPSLADNVLWQAMYSNSLDKRLKGVYIYVEVTGHYWTYSNSEMKVTIYDNVTGHW